MSSKFGSTVQLPVGMRHSSLPPAFPILLIGVVGADDHLPGLKSSDLRVEMRQRRTDAGPRGLRTSSCPGPFHSSCCQLGTPDILNAKGAQNMGGNTGGYIRAYLESF